MMSLDTLFNISTTEYSFENKTINAEVELDPKHDIFKGHFPESPVLPGVCIIHIIKSVLEKHLEKELKLDVAQSIKFSLPINPHENRVLNVEIVFKSLENNVDISASVTAPDKKFCSFRGVFS